MKRDVLILSNWANKNSFNKLRDEADKYLKEVASLSYLVCVNNVKDVAELPHIPQVNFVTKKDFSMFGKIKSVQLKSILNNKDIVLISAIENLNKLNNKVLKQAKMLSIGVEDKNNSPFQMLFKNASVNGGDLFQKVNKYITKIR